MMLIFMVMATDVLGTPIVSQMVSDLIAYMPRLLSAIVLFILGIYLAEFVKNILLITLNSLSIPSAKIIANFVFYLVFLADIFLLALFLMLYELYLLSGFLFWFENAV